MSDLGVSKYYWHLVVEVRAADKHPIVHRTAHTTELACPNDSDAGVEKSDPGDS